MKWTMPCHQSRCAPGLSAPQPAGFHFFVLFPRQPCLALRGKSSISSCLLRPSALARPGSSQSPKETLAVLLCATVSGFWSREGGKKVFRFLFLKQGFLGFLHSFPGCSQRYIQIGGGVKKRGPQPGKMRAETGTQQMPFHLSLYSRPALCSPSPRSYTNTAPHVVPATGDRPFLCSLESFGTTLKLYHFHIQLLFVKINA
jgi:hypothetical protein